MQSVRRENLKVVIMHIILILGGISMILPFVWMFVTSIKPATEVLSWPPSFIPKSPTLDNYRAVLQEAPFGRYFLNTLLISTISALSILFTSSLSGFIFAKYKFPGRNVLFLVLLTTAMIPLECYMISLYLLINRFGWINTYQGVVAPILVMAFGVFFMRQNILSIPNELLDAARIDGCSEWRIYTTVILPLSRSALGALAIFAYMQAWAFFIWPLIVINDRNLYTMELGLTMFQKRFTVDYGLISAGSMIAVLPILVIFLILRRNIIEGITLTGLKG
ncbi:MAG: multiple sugar transport system permease protein [Candidatus Atribacteria bacterium]|nr:multiple sugar transport system permease protein [Candidatus Atribacteria bacterium]